MLCLKYSKFADCYSPDQTEWCYKSRFWGPRYAFETVKDAKQGEISSYDGGKYPADGFHEASGFWYVLLN